MAANKPPPDRLLNLAAELRAGGASWESIAAKLKRVPSTIRRWANKYRDRWFHALLHAERHLVAGAGGESVNVLRLLLRSKDPMVCWHAARCLIGLRVELGKLDARTRSAGPPPESSPEPDPILSFLSRCSDDELSAFLESLRRALARKALPVGPGHGAGPG